VLLSNINFHRKFLYCTYSIPRVTTLFVQHRDGTGTVARVPVFPGVGPLSNDIAGNKEDFTRLHNKKLVSLLSICILHNLYKGRFVSHKSRVFLGQFVSILSCKAFKITVTLLSCKCLN